MPRASWLLDDSCLRLIEGQWLYTYYEQSLDVGVGEYVDMISLKTGAPVGCAVEMAPLSLSSRARAGLEEIAGFLIECSH